MPMPMPHFNPPSLLSLFFLLFLLLIPSVLAAPDCQCPEDSEDDGKRDETLALKYKVVAIATILVAGIIGVVIPLLGKLIPALSPEKDIFFIIKAFAAGVILATGFIHVLPDAYGNLTSSKLNEHPWGKFPFTGLVAMVAAIGTLMVDAGASSYYTRIHLNKAQPELNGDDEMRGGGCGAHDGHVHVHTHGTHGHAHGSADVGGSSTEILRHRVISQVTFRN